jgi:hypothetical protein
MPFPQSQNVSPSRQKSPTPPQFTTLLAATFVFVHRFLPRLSTARQFPGMLLVLAVVAGLASVQAAAVVDQKSGAAVTPAGKALLQGTVTGGGTADVTVFWGPPNGGTTPAHWANTFAEVSLNPAGE